MRAFVLVLLLAGCGGLDQEAKRCGELPDIPSYSQCIERYNARVAREEQQSQWANSSSEDSAALLLMGATAFSNGYTQSLPSPMLTCFHTGMMTMCQ